MRTGLAFSLVVTALIVPNVAHAQNVAVYVYEKDGLKTYSSKPPVAGVPYRKIAPQIRKLTVDDQRAAEAETAAANAYIDDLYRRGREELAREQMAAYQREEAARRADLQRQLAFQKEQLMRQQEQLDALEKSRRSDALQESLRAVNRDMQNVLQQTAQPIVYPAPNVEQFSPYRPPVAHCRTIGYITTCN